MRVPWYITAAFGATLAAVILLVLGYDTTARQQALSLQWVDHTWRVKSELDRLENEIGDADASIHAYLLAGRDELLTPYRDAQQQSAATLDAIAKLTSDNPRQIANNSALKSLLGQMFRRMSDALAMRASSGDADKAAQLLSSADASGLHARLRTMLQTMGDEESQLLGERENAYRAASVREQGTVVGASIIAILLVCILYATVLRALKQRDEVGQELARVNRGLREEVAARTTQLSALSHHLLSVSERDRDKLARELHDELGSHVSAALMDVTAVARELKRAEQTELVPAVERAIDTLRASTHIGREIVANLRPIMLREFGLAQTIDALCAKFSQASAITCERKLAQNLQFTEETAIALYRITQEALSNVRRHSQATRVVVTLARAGNAIELAIEDDGKGMGDADAASADVHGVLGMRERALALGGTFHIGRRDGAHGTIVRVTVPTEAALRP